MKGIDLDRFTKAQKNVYETALQELKRGKKQGHWMWFIFPQVKGLGHSDVAQYYAIRDREEAEAYTLHPVLFPRLLEITSALLDIKTDNISSIMHYPDDLKLKSSMTLFYYVSGNNVFKYVLDKFFEGKMDDFTISFLDKF